MIEELKAIEYYLFFWDLKNNKKKKNSKELWVSELLIYKELGLFSFLIDMTKLCPLCRKLESLRGKGRKVLGEDSSCFLHMRMLEFLPLSHLICLHFLGLELKMLQSIPGIKIVASADMMLFWLDQGIILILLETT